MVLLHSFDLLSRDITQGTGGEIVCWLVGRFYSIVSVFRSFLRTIFLPQIIDAQKRAAFNVDIALFISRGECTEANQLKCIKLGNCYLLCSPYPSFIYYVRNHF